MNRRVALALSGLLFAWVPAAAQDWPTKTVRIIVPFGPGSTPDMVGRLIADHMQQKLGQPFVIENRPGASANTGTEMVAKADPDGTRSASVWAARLPSTRCCLRTCRTTQPRTSR